MAVGTFIPSDLLAIHKVVQNTQLTAAKELLVSTLRDYFRQSFDYHYVSDEYGFPKVLDRTDVPLEAGIEDDEATRIWIGQESKQDVNFYPAVTIRHTGANYKAISFNQDRDCVQFEKRIFTDGYGRNHTISVPQYFLFVGAWDTNFDIDIETESPETRMVLAENITMLFQNIANWELQAKGLFIKSTRLSGEQSVDKHNDKIFKQTVSLECRGEYRRVIPIDSVVDVINVCIEFGLIGNDSPPAENLRINFELDLLDVLLGVG